jgi:coenzyme F420 hydrogenase subunit beta
MVMTDAGRERPVVCGELDRPTWHRIEAACPGTRIEGVARSDVPAAATVDPIWGPIIRVVNGHATEPEVRYRAASGGVLTALGQFLLDSGRVELVLHVTASREAPMRSTGQISFDRAEVLAGTGSRYGPAAPLRDLRTILEGGRPFALIGKPCDVTAVRSLAKVQPRLASQLRYALAMVCGGASELGKSQEVLTQFAIEESDVSLFRYRGHGNPGLTRIQAHDGRSVGLTYGEMWEDEAGWRIQSRCKICPDAIGEVADIVAGDTWPDATPPDNDDGFNAVLVRTEAGLELFDAAVAAGVLTIENDIPTRRLDDFNPHQVVKKRAVAARLAGIRAAGGPIPRVRHLRIGRLARDAGWRSSLSEFLGGFRRSRRGSFSEPSPVPERRPAGPVGFTGPDRDPSR